jgi:hypothetical protein
MARFASIYFYVPFLCKRFNEKDANLVEEFDTNLNQLTAHNNIRLVRFVTFLNFEQKSHRDALIFLQKEKYGKTCFGQLTFIGNVIDFWVIHNTVRYTGKGRNILFTTWT